MVCGALSDDHLIQLKVVTGTLNAQKYQDENLEFGVRSPWNSLGGQNMLPLDDSADVFETENQPYQNHCEFC